MLVGRLGPRAEGGVVTAFAVGLESESCVIGIGSPAQVILVAGLACCRCTGILLAVSPVVAGLTVNDCMDTGEREAPFGVLQQETLLRLPIPRNVALAAIGPELALMMVGVAIDAGRTDMAEDLRLVTSGAGGLPVGAGKTEAGFIMIEGHLGTQGGPRISGVARLAVPLQRTVRVAAVL